MAREASHCTLPLAEVRPRLRDDLRYSPRANGEQTYCVIEDRLNSRYYQVGLAEYTFISLMDGNTSLSEALRLTATQLGEQALTEAEAETILKWLIDCQLASTPSSVAAGRLLNVRAARRRILAGQLNPLLIKLPLFNPQRLLDAITPWLSWAFGRFGLALVGTLFLVAVRQLLCHADRLGHAANLAIAANNWGWLLLTFCVLKLLHELGHAVTCRRFGGHVREAGVMLLLLAPIPYVDVTSSWQFRCKWQRIATASAGMLVELVCAGLAVLLWSATDHPLVRYHAFNVMLLGSVTTIAFNANFLMRFDGYYVLTDWLEIPNLYLLGQEFMSGWLRHNLLGISDRPARWPAGRWFISKSYAVASLMWRILVCGCLLLLAERMLFGFGLILSIFALSLWLVWPLARGLATLFRQDTVFRPNWRHAAAAMAACGCLVGALFTVVPWPFRIAAPGIVQYADAAVVRTASPGLVREICVSPGAAVHAGQVLLVLENRELDESRQDLELSLAQSRLRSRVHYRNGHMAAFQAEAATQTALERRLSELAIQCEQLVVRSPRGGVVVARGLSSLAGRRLSVGAELMTIAAEHEKELVVSIGQDVVEDFRATVGQPLMVCAYPGQGLRCPLEQVAPKGSDEIQAAALAVSAGGPLAIQAGAASESSGPYRWRYLQPRFAGLVRFTSDQSTRLRAGQRAVLKLTSARRSFGGHCYQCVRDWLARQRRPR